VASASHGQDRHSQEVYEVSKPVEKPRNKPFDNMEVDTWVLIRAEIAAGVRNARGCPWSSFKMLSLWD